MLVLRRVQTWTSGGGPDEENEIEEAGGREEARGTEEAGGRRSHRRRSLGREEAIGREGPAKEKLKDIIDYLFQNSDKLQEGVYLDLSKN